MDHSTADNTLRAQQKHHPYEDAPEPGGARPRDDVDDLLLLAALAANVSTVLLARRQPDRSWSLRWHGQPGDPPVPSDFLDRIASGTEPAEITDALQGGTANPIKEFPGSMRWAFGVPIRGADGGLLAVMVLLDPWLRTTGHREETAIRATVRRMKAILTASPAWPAEPAVEPSAERPSSPDDGEAETEATIPSPPLGPAGPRRIRLLRSGDVATLFDVTERTVINWAASGRLPSLRTVGGHLRFRSDDVNNLLGVR